MTPEERKAEVGEYTINYASAGGGDPLMLIHGSEPGESWKVWEPILALADGHKVVAPDLVGYGRSSRPVETPDYKGQAHALLDLWEKLGLGRTGLVGAGWGGQVALEVALGRPEAVGTMVLIASSYDKGQLKAVAKLRKPTLIVYAEDDMVTQLKAGYLLRDAIGTSRIEVLDAVARDPAQDFRMSHRLQRFRGPQLLQLVRLFLANPGSMVAEPPQMEEELKGMAMRRDDSEDAQPSGTP